MISNDSRAPNILVLIADDLSKSCLGCYGDRHVRTPHLDQLAREGMRFERAYVTSPQCSPSRSSILTGRTPHAIGTSRLHSELRPDVPTIIEPLRRRGYFTGMYRKNHLGDQFLNRLDFYGGKEESFATFFDLVPADRPFFLWVGFNDPHRDLYANYEHIRGQVAHPHDPGQVTVPPFLPDTPAMRSDFALHYDAISRLDDDCGRILKVLQERGLADNTLVVFLSDHGMPYPRSKATLYEPGVNVPMVIRWRGKVRPGTVTDELVSTVDLPATWLEAAGLPPLPVMESRSLMKLLTGAPWEPRRYVFTERNWHDTWEPTRGIVSRRYALICNCRPEMSYRGSLDHVSAPAWDIVVAEHKAGRLRPELQFFHAPRPMIEFYDLENDANEFDNRADDPAVAEIVDTMLLALDRWMRDTNDFLPPPATFPEIELTGKMTLKRVLDGPLPTTGGGGNDIGA